MNFIDRILEAEREAERPAWERFWASYRPLQMPPAPRRPSPFEIAEYIKSNPAAVALLFPQSARPELVA
jgi:hypothetical protein